LSRGNRRTAGTEFRIQNSEFRKAKFKHKKRGQMALEFYVLLLTTGYWVLGK